MDPVCKRIPAVYQALDIAKAIVNEKGRGGDECVRCSFSKESLGLRKRINRIIRDILV